MADPVIIGTRPPKQIFQIDRLRYRTPATGFYDSDGWKLVVSFITHDDTTVSGDNQTELTVANGAVSEYSPGVWEVDLDSSGATTPSTQAWAPGLYFWQEFFEKASAADRQTCRKGTMKLDVPYGSSSISGGADFRSWARIALSNIEAVLQKKANLDQLSFAIAGRSLQRYSPSELMEFRKMLLEEIQREDAEEAFENDGAIGYGTINVELG